jgi:hypothetical protein
MDVCRAVVPDLITIKEHHRVACHLVKEGSL